MSRIIIERKRLLEHYRDFLYYYDWFWKCEHKDYTDQEVLKWVRTINKRDERRTK